MKYIALLAGKYRLFWGLCPWCNSDAPHLYDCPICEYYNGKYPPPKELKNKWWKRFKEHNTGKKVTQVKQGNKWK